jgi:hypothetical protein
MATVPKQKRILGSETHKMQLVDHVRTLKLIQCSAAGILLQWRDAVVCELMKQKQQLS